MSDPILLVRAACIGCDAPLILPADVAPALCAKHVDVSVPPALGARSHVWRAVGRNKPRWHAFDARTGALLCGSQSCGQLVVDAAPPVGLPAAPDFPTPPGILHGGPSGMRVCAACETIVAKRRKKAS